MKRQYFLASALVCAAAFAHGGAITITEQATGNGILDGTLFTGKLITLTFHGDTANIVAVPNAFYIIGTGSVTVAGVGSDTLSHSMQAVVNQNFSQGGFVDYIDAGNQAVIILTTNAGFAAYGLAGAVGPLTGSTFLTVAESFPTVSAGTFGISAITVIADQQLSTFTATVASTPEPGSFVLLGLGIAGIAALKLRRARVG